MCVSSEHLKMLQFFLPVNFTSCSASPGCFHTNAHLFLLSGVFSKLWNKSTFSENTETDSRSLFSFFPLPSMRNPGIRKAALVYWFNFVSWNWKCPGFLPVMLSDSDGLDVLFYTETHASARLVQECVLVCWRGQVLGQCLSFCPVGDLITENTAILIISWIISI